MKAILFSTVLLSGLVAGLFYAYSCSVNPGLKSLSDSEYIRAMQSINVAILNPLFFVSFMGLLALFPLSAYQSYGQGSTFYFLLGATVIYFIGTFGVTIFFNVPLNDRLAKFPILMATADESSAMRQAFEKPWNTYHTIRTVAAVVAFGLAILSVFRQKA